MRPCDRRPLQTLRGGRDELSGRVRVVGTVRDGCEGFDRIVEGPGLDRREVSRPEAGDGPLHIRVARIRGEEPPEFVGGRGDSKREQQPGGFRTRVDERISLGLLLVEAHHRETELTAGVGIGPALVGCAVITRLLAVNWDPPPDLSAQTGAMLRPIWSSGGHWAKRGPFSGQKGADRGPGRSTSLASGPLMIDVGVVLEGRYAVTQRLAQGGMANVFIARDRALERDVAVKVVRPSSADDRARFEREARLLAGLEHPNLVRIYGAHHTADDEAYIVLEYVEGQTLADVVAQGSLMPAQVAVIGAQVADALAFIHERGVIHRDVKPSNVFVGDDGRVRLSDFGIARHYEDTHLTQVGMIIGTGAYMAPEQVEGREVTAAADVYALGLMLLEALTGHPAYAGTVAETTMARLVRQPDIPALSAPWPVLLASMTARQPEQRPTATQVAAQLRGAPPLPARPPRCCRYPRRSRRAPEVEAPWSRPSWSRLHWSH